VVRWRNRRIHTGSKEIETTAAIGAIVFYRNLNVAKVIPVVAAVHKAAVHELRETSTAAIQGAVSLVVVLWREERWWRYHVDLGGAFSPSLIASQEFLVQFGRIQKVDLFLGTSSSLWLLVVLILLMFVLGPSPL